MEASNVALWGLAIAIIANALALFFKSPKEIHSDLVTRVAELEGRHHALSQRFEGVYGKHDQALSSLTAAINRLTERFDRYMGSRDGRA